MSQGQLIDVTFTLIDRGGMIYYYYVQAGSRIMSLKSSSSAELMACFDGLVRGRFR